VFKKPEDIPKALTKHRSFLGSYTWFLALIYS
jgi:hypothetical protein